MRKSAILASILFIAAITTISFGKKDYPVEYHNAANKLYDTAIDLETQNPDAAIAIYNKIIEDFPDAFAQDAVVTFIFAEEARERKILIHCLRSGIEKKRIAEFNDFFQLFRKCIGTKDIYLFKQLTTCELRVGFQPISGDNQSIIEIDKFWNNTINEIPQNLLNVELQKTDYIFSDYTYSAIRINELKTALFMGDDKNRAAFYIQKNPLNKNSPIEIFLFKKNKYWYFTHHFLNSH
jgi:hypothetical protein